jgi:ribosome modulation factor
MNEVIQQGYDAYLAEKSEQDNPYDPDFESYRLWLKGYLMAEKEKSSDK